MYLLKKTRAARAEWSDDFNRPDRMYLSDDPRWEDGRNIMAPVGIKDQQMRLSQRRSDQNTTYVAYTTFRQGALTPIYGVEFDFASGYGLFGASGEFRIRLGNPGNFHLGVTLSPTQVRIIYRTGSSDLQTETAALVTTPAMRWEGVHVAIKIENDRVVSVYLDHASEPAVVGTVPAQYATSTGNRSVRLLNDVVAESFVDNFRLWDMSGAISQDNFTTTTAQDTFERSNGGLGAPWTSATTLPLEIVSGEAGIPGGFATDGLRCSLRPTGVDSDDMSVEATIGDTIGMNSQWSHVIVRADAAFTSQVALGARDNAWALRHYTSPTAYTTLVEASRTMVHGDRIRVDADGGLLRFWINGVVHGTWPVAGLIPTGPAYRLCGISSTRASLLSSWRHDDFTLRTKG